MRIKNLAAAMAAILLLVSAPAWAQGLSADRYFRVEHEVERLKSGRSRLTGYVYNDYVLTAANVRLLVEGLESSGRVVSETLGYVDAELSPGGRAYFHVPLPMEAATYRVRVHSFTWHRVGY